MHRDFYDRIFLLCSVQPISTDSGQDFFLLFHFILLGLIFPYDTVGDYLRKSLILEPLLSSVVACPPVFNVAEPIGSEIPCSSFAYCCPSLARLWSCVAACLGLAPQFRLCLPCCSTLLSGDGRRERPGGGGGCRLWSCRWMSNLELPDRLCGLFTFSTMMVLLNTMEDVLCV